MKALYKYPQAAYPYALLVKENKRRDKSAAEFELIDTGVLDGGRYFDVFVEYAKATPDDIRIRLTIANHGPDTAVLHVLPQLWFRNTWSWGRSGEGYGERPQLERHGAAAVICEHPTLGRMHWCVGTDPGGQLPELLFTQNDSNLERLWGTPNASPYVKDAFHDHVVHERPNAVDPAGRGTKAAAHYRLSLAAGATATLRLRLAAANDLAEADGIGADFEAVFAARRAEADAYYAEILPPTTTPEERLVMRQGYAGLLWSKQFFHYVVGDWLQGDPSQPPPPAVRLSGRNSDWKHLYNRDVISMPDKWEYPWYAAWDLAFHMLPFADIDPEFAKSQLVLFLREWYMHPNGQIPAYEWAMGDVNPPVHAWAVWRTYKITGPKGGRDRLFLERCFQKLLINFTWWVNRKDVTGKNVFGGGFLGLDNIGVFDRWRWNSHARMSPTKTWPRSSSSTSWRSPMP
jgi:hypothetical protein